jgi:serine protease Do
LNFAIPCESLAVSVDGIRSGKMAVAAESSDRKPSEPMTPRLIGMVLVPDIVSRTPPYVDRVVSGSAAEQAGVLADDLVIEINGRLTPGTKDVVEQLSRVDRDAGFRLTVQRGTKFQTFEIRLQK